MSQFLERGASSAAEDVYLELKSNEGEIAVYSNATTAFNIEVWNGAAYADYTQEGNVASLNSSNNSRLIQGPGIFKIPKPINTSLAIFVGLDASVRWYGTADPKA